MKTQEELNALKAEVENLKKKLDELSGAELAWVSGGIYVLTPIKEKELLAATDTSTSSDRASLQKEIERLIDKTKLQEWINNQSKEWID